jgi:drug/metabolite transporter (DMT)-like permease
LEEKMAIVTEQKGNVNRGYLFAFLSAVILSTTGIMIRYLTQNYALPALVLAFWRDLFVILPLGLILLIFRPKFLKIPLHFLPLLVLYGLVLAIFNSAWTLSVSLNGAAVATVLSYCSAAFTAILGWLILREHMGWGKMAAVLFSLSGCVLVSGALYSDAWKGNLLGIFTGVGAGLCYAFYSLMGRAYSQRGLNIWAMQFYTFSFAAIFLLLFNLLFGGTLPGTAPTLADMLWSRLDMKGWAILFILAAVPTLLGFGAYNVSLTYLPSSVANLIATLEPVFTTIIAYFLFGEVLTFIQLIGGAMIVGGVVIIRLTEKPTVSLPSSEHTAG